MSLNIVFVIFLSFQLNISANPSSNSGYSSHVDDFLIHFLQMAKRSIRITHKIYIEAVQEGI
jgi:hypothetical protein